MSTTEEKAPHRISVAAKSFRINQDGTEGVLLGRKCRECGEVFFGQPEYCLRCTAHDLEPIDLTGEGVVTTYTIVRQAPPGWQGDIPYLLVTVKVPEGPSVMSEMVDSAGEDLEVGMAVELTLRVGATDNDGNEIVVYKWRPKKAG